MPGVKSFRADELLFRQGVAVSRTAARHFIEEGRVQTEAGSTVRKPSQSFPEGTSLRLLPGDDYVSRGAKKLLGGWDAFHPSVKGLVCLDLGASTGGFTEVLLRHGARLVYAVDVGTDQLHPRLRQDSRVVVLERTNARALDRTLIPEPVDFLTGDLSFISLTKVLPAAAPLLSSVFQAILLIKPQFECGRGELGSGGIVRDPAVRLKCVEKIIRFCQEELGWSNGGCVPSPITGGDGNQEFLALFSSP